MAAQCNFAAQCSLGMLFRIALGQAAAGECAGEVSAASPGKQRIEKRQVLQQLTEP